MSVHSIDGNTFSRDVRQDRIAAGTVGDDHVVKFGISPQSINQEIAMTDPRIQYLGGAGSGTWTISIPTSGNYRHAQVATCNTAGAQLAVNFTGTKISVLGPLRSDGGKFDTYIDGNLYSGVTNYFGYIPTTIPAGQQSALTSSQLGVLSSTATSIACDTASFSGFPSSGTIKLDDEYITYSSKDAGNHYFTGCTRGANNSSAATHVIGSPIYYVSNSVDTYQSAPDWRNVLWTVDNLQQGPHQLVLQVRSDKNASSSDTRLYVESIVIGGLLGGTVLNTVARSYNAGNVLTNGSGYAEIGAMNSNNQTEQIIAIIGVSDDSHTVKWQVDESHNVWINGANNTTYNNVRIQYMALGRTI